MTSTSDPTPVCGPSMRDYCFSAPLRNLIAPVEGRGLVMDGPDAFRYLELYGRVHYGRFSDEDRSEN